MSCDPGISLVPLRLPPPLRRPLGGSTSRGSFYHAYLEARQLGLLRGASSDTLLRERLYRDLGRRPAKSVGDRDDLSPSWRFDQLGAKVAAHNGPVGEVGPTGGIYNLEFNTDGSLLAAACEQKNVLLFDPASRKLVKSLEKAHEDGVNCVRFLDNRSFATCSDDTTVALWDARNLKHRVRSLRGHTNWVKNIEFSRRENCLVTSGLDGAICLWDINRYSEVGDNAKKIFHTNGLMRMCLSGFGDRMVISTMNGYLIVVHDLSLEDMQADLKDFKPNMYRLLQLSGGKAISSAANFTPLFHAKRNRIEFISDFAPTNEAEFISSLKLHPQGWVAVSRNVSAGDVSEWCCVHDVHALPPTEDDDETLPEIQKQTLELSENASSSSNQNRSRNATGLSRLAEFLYENRNTEPSEPSSPPRRQRSQRNLSLPPPEPMDFSAADRVGDGIRASVSVSGPTASSSVISISGVGTNGRVRIRSDEVANQSRQLVESLINRRRRRVRDDDDEQENGPEASQERPDNDWENRGIVLVTPSLGSGTGNWVYFGTPREHRSQRVAPVPTDAKVYKNRNRLTHYIEESNTGKGYIKEVSFTPDGRVFCSPFGFGVRLLAFDERCADLSLGAPTDTEPRLLYEIGTVVKCHRDVVLSSAFSPNSFTLVTGCLGGDIVWHQPLP